MSCANMYTCIQSRYQGLTYTVRRVQKETSFCQGSHSDIHVVTGNPAHYVAPSSMNIQPPDRACFPFPLLTLSHCLHANEPNALTHTRVLLYSDCGASRDCYWCSEQMECRHVTQCCNKSEDTAACCTQTPFSCLSSVCMKGERVSWGCRIRVGGDEW